MLFSRRQALKLAAGAAAFSFAGGIAPVDHAKAGVSSTRYLVASTQTVATIVDLDSLGTNVIPLGFPPHSFVQHPRFPEKIWAIKMRALPGGVPPAGEETSLFAAEIDLREKKVVKTLLLPDGELFGGHGFFTPQGDVLFIARMDKKGLSYLTGYDYAFDCRKVVADYPLGAGFIHDAQLLADGTAMVASAGLTRYDSKFRVKKDELIQIDLYSGKPLRRWRFEDDRQWMSHFAMLKDAVLIAVSDGAVSQSPGVAWSGRSEQSALREIPYAGAVQPGRPGELLSLAVNEAHNVAVVTNPINGRMLVIDITHGSFIREVPHRANSATGLVFDQKFERFIGSGDDVCILDGDGNRISGKDADRFAKLGSFNGSHSFLAEVPHAS